MTYESLAFKGQSDYYRRPLLETFGFGVYYTVSQLMSQLGALRESDFDMHIQQYGKKDRLNLLSVSRTTSVLTVYLWNVSSTSSESVPRVSRPM